MLESTPRVKAPRFATYGRGGTLGGNDDAGAPCTEEKKQEQQVDAEIERYKGLYILASEVRRIEY